jgi:hypothetical protein
VLHRILAPRPWFQDTYRAHPDYCSDGPWYDWAMVKFENFGDYPSQMLLLYRKHDPVVDNDTGKVTNSGIYTIIHNCEMRSDTSSQRKAWMHETELCS